MGDTLALSHDGDPASAGETSGALVIVYSPDTSAIGRSFSLDSLRGKPVGREVTDGLQISDARVSKLHLRFVARTATGAISFADAGSSNGTFVNGRPEARGELGASDVLRIGDTLLVMRTGPGVDEVRARAERAGPSHLPVLVLGETGTGKELLAKQIHAASLREGAFVPVNCATLPRELAAAELFGHARGAFSGATGARPGLFRAADRGTLFLDEIGDLPLDLQPAILRALEEKGVRPLGGEHEVPVDARIVAATHADLDRAVAERKFRADLLARLAHVVLKLPPLRSRREEILGLARGFAPDLRFSPDAAEALLLSNWPRNIRELKAVVESLAALDMHGSTVRLSHLADRIPDGVDRVRGRRSTASAEGEEADDMAPAKRRERLKALLERHEGNVAAVARELGKTRAQVYRWVHAFGLTVSGFRSKG